MPEVRFAAIPDCHIPYHDKKALNCALKVLDWYKPEVVVVLGDFLDMAPVSHWLKNKRKTKEGMSLAKDYAKANEVLDRLLKPWVKEFTYLEGNHEDWINDALEESPEFAGLIELSVGLRFKERRAGGLKINQFPYGKCWNLGKLWFTHGTYTGVNHAKKHVDAFERNIVYGHLDRKSHV